MLKFGINLKLSSKMATGGDLSLTDSEIEALAREMEARKMESIAISGLGLTVETVNNLKVKRQGDYMGFNRDVLVLWRNMNQGIDQAQVSEITNLTTIFVASITEASKPFIAGCYIAFSLLALV